MAGISPSAAPETGARKFHAWPQPIRERACARADPLLMESKARSTSLFYRASYRKTASHFSGRTLVILFRHLRGFAAPARANVGIKGYSQLCEASGALNLTFASGFTAGGGSNVKFASRAKCCNRQARFFALSKRNSSSPGAAGLRCFQRGMKAPLMCRRRNSGYEHHRDARKRANGAA